MAGKIFINYRRGDDPAFTHALDQRLEDEFTADDLFMDVEGHIKPGFDRAIRNFTPTSPTRPPSAPPPGSNGQQQTTAIH